MRKVFFWTHLLIGTSAGIVVLIMSVTGVLLMYERQMIEWADRSMRSVPPDSAERMPAEQLVPLIREAAGGAAPANIVIHSDPAGPVEAAFGRERTLLFDAYTGRLLGEGSKGIRSFFRVVTDWHRWLAMEGDRRATGRAITGAANLGFLFLVLSGMYLWLPRRWAWQQVRAVFLFRSGLSGKARDFNWHNVIGIWSAIPLFFVVLGAVMISYPWATNLLYRATGSPPPVAAAKPPAPGAGAGGGRRAAMDLTGLDQAVQAAQKQAGEWKTISFRPANGDKVSFAVAGSHRGRPDKRSTVVVSRASGQVIEHETFESYSMGRKLRSWLRFLHTGEALGFVGQTVAGLVSAGGAVLVWTGIALSWRRFTAFRKRRRTGTEQPLAAAR